VLAKWPVDFEMGRKIYLLGLHVIVKIAILLQVFSPAQCFYKVGAVCFYFYKVGAVATQQGLLVDNELSSKGGPTISSDTESLL